MKKKSFVIIFLLVWMGKKVLRIVGGWRDVGLVCGHLNYGIKFEFFASGLQISSKAFNYEISFLIWPSNLPKSRNIFKNSLRSAVLLNSELNF